MRLLLSIGSWNPAHGGPFFSVGNLARAMAAAGNEVHLLAGTYPHLPPGPAPVGVRLHLIAGRLIPGIRQTWIPRSKAQLDAVIREVAPELIHDNGLWLTLNHEVALAAHRHGIPLVLSPRGTLDPWAMQYRNWKKRIALALYQRKDLEHVAAFHAASELEADNIRKFGLKQPIALIPNGVDIPGEPAHFRIGENGREQGAGSREAEISKQGTAPCPMPHALSSPLRTALFVGRMHPVKNLPALLEAWAKVKPKGWRLKLVGSSEVGHREELERLAGQLGIRDQVEFSDPVYGEAKAELFRNAQLFCLVSHSENFGIAAAEGLAAGLPLIASKSIPWEIVEKENAGWWVNGSASGLAEAIREATSLEPEKLKAKGLRGRQLAEREFVWDAIAERFTSVYKWVTKICECPSCVQA